MRPRVSGIMDAASSMTACWCVCSLSSAPLDTIFSRRARSVSTSFWYAVKSLDVLQT